MIQLVPLLSLLVGGPMPAVQEAPASPAKVELKLDATHAAPGGTVKGRVLVTFAPGWHGYQNPPMQDHEIPLEIESATKALKLKATYPKGDLVEFAGTKTLAYEGTVAVPVALTFPKTSGSFTFKLVVSYQQCNESSCLPPEKKAVSSKILLKAPPKAPIPPKPKKPPANA